MYFRFSAALSCIVAVSLIGVSVESGNNRLRQQIDAQHQRLATLADDVAAARSTTEKLGAPSQLLDKIDSTPVAIEPASSTLR